MDPMIRLAIWMSQIWRHGVDRRTVVVFFVVLAAGLALATIEWLGYWPESWRAQPISRFAAPPPPAFDE
jgi:hypothetical protein